MAAAEVASYWRQRSPATFAHVALDERGRRVIVYRLPSGADLDRVVRRRFASVRIGFRDAQRSERDLRVLTAQVMRDLAYWRDRGIDITGFGPNPEEGVVQVTTPDPEKARDELWSRYGNRVVVREGGPWMRGPYSPNNSIESPDER